MRFITTVCPGSSDPFYIATFLHKIGHYFLDTQYIKLDLLCYFMFKKQLPILYSNLLHKMGYYFLDTQQNISNTGFLRCNQYEGMLTRGCMLYIDRMSQSQDMIKATTYVFHILPQCYIVNHATFPNRDVLRHQQAFISKEKSLLNLYVSVSFSLSCSIMETFALNINVLNPLKSLKITK